MYSTEEQLVLLDLFEGCSITPTSPTGPCCVMPILGNAIPHTHGQVNGEVLLKLTTKALVSNEHGEYNLTRKGLDAAGRLKH